jgi:hypothetical protein
MSVHVVMSALIPPPESGGWLGFQVFWEHHLLGRSGSWPRVARRSIEPRGATYVSGRRPNPRPGEWSPSSRVRLRRTFDPLGGPANRRQSGGTIVAA